MMCKFLCVLPRAPKNSKLKIFRARFARPFLLHSNFLHVGRPYRIIFPILELSKGPSMNQVNRAHKNFWDLLLVCCHHLNKSACGRVESKN